VAERSAKRKRSKGGFVEYFGGLPGSAAVGGAKTCKARYSMDALA
jgi:hypothetical protein